MAIIKDQSLSFFKNLYAPIAGWANAKDSKVRWSFLGWLLTSLVSIAGISLAIVGGFPEKGIMSITGVILGFAGLTYNLVISVFLFFHLLESSYMKEKRNKMKRDIEEKKRKILGLEEKPTSIIEAAKTEEVKMPVFVDDLEYVN